MQPLRGKTAVITGASSGVGLACAKAFLDAGAEAIVINGRRQDRGEKALEEIKSSFPSARLGLAIGDMSRADHAQAVMAQANDELGRIDILINSTGGSDVPALLHNTPLEQIPLIIEHYLFAQLLSCRAALPYMRAAKHGCIINIASDAAKIPTPGESVIGAAMAGIVMFTRTLAVEGKRDGIRANVLTPSLVSGTEQYQRVMSDPFAGKMFAKAIPMAALGVVNKDELAQLAVFLASPAAAKMTGQAVSMTGGISAL